MARFSLKKKMPGLSRPVTSGRSALNSAVGHKCSHDNRINLVIAVVFLFGAVIIYKLFDLQILKYDLYAAIASKQHATSSQLIPERGKIYISAARIGTGNEKEYFQFATNKDFALVYAIPKDLKKADEIAEKIYLAFDDKIVKEEVEKEILDGKKGRQNNELDYLNSLNLSAEEKKIKESEIKAKYLSLTPEQTILENNEREAKIKEKHDKKIEEYKKILTKENDPYEPLKKKVDETSLINFYSLLLSSEGSQISATDLSFKEGKIYKNSEEVNFPGIGFEMETYRYYPEANVGAQVLGFTSMNGEEQKGQYGLEGYFNNQLFGKYGSVKTEKGADRKVIIANDREYIAPENGDDVYLTIDRSIEYYACQKLDEVAQRHGADGGTVIIVDPKTGAIMAMCSWPNFNPNDYKDVNDIDVYNNPAIFDQYEPGSVFKAITMASALDQEKVTPETTYEDAGQIMIPGWPKPISNSDYETFGGHGKTNMNTVLELSLNTGAIFAMEQIGAKTFANYVKSFGFGQKTGIELESENVGNIKNLLVDKIKQIDAAVASFGQGLTVTPLQMIMSYAALANHGILMQPYIVDKITRADGTEEKTEPRQIRRVISEKAADIVSGMLVNVVEEGHSKRAQIDGYYIAGKTGTAQVASSISRGYSGKTIHTFIGYAPVEDPKFVMLVKLDNPKDATFAESTSVPLFNEIAKYVFNYLQIPKERSEMKK